VTGRGPREYWPVPPPVATPWPQTFLWRWRYEIGGAGLLGVLGWRSASSPALLLVAGVVLVIALAVPPVRRILVAQFWVVVVQHRLRSGFARAWVHDRRGRLPALLWTRRTRHGQRIVVWCPAGVTVRNLEDAAEVLQGACWASGLTVEPGGRYRHLAIVEVVRRDPREARLR
jgi:hypothetical protein